jgi:glutamate carboxypeptidase
MPRMASSPTSDLLARVRADEDAYLTTLRTLVEHESPSHDAAAGNRLAGHLAEILTEDGWTVELLPAEGAGDIVRARLDDATSDAGDATLLLAHYDTVWPLGTLAEMPWRRDGDRVAGPGVLDMKAGIAGALHAVRAVRAVGSVRGPVTLLVTSDEETGSLASRALIEEEARRHARVLVLEPGRDDGALKVGRKGVGDVRVRVRGVSAHAGLNPEEGASALRELAHLLLFAEGLADPQAGTTVNLTVASGGSASNVVAEAATARIDVRVATLAEGERVLTALRGYRPRDPRVEVRVDAELNRPPMEATPANRALADEARGRLRELGWELGQAVVGGGSDGNFTSALGIATLDGLGGVGGGAHARHEHVRLRETLERVALTGSLLLKSP